MKRIRMKTLAAGPMGCFQVNDERVLPDDEADALIRRHNADLIEVIKEPEPVETATVEAPERAARVGRPAKKATKKRAAKRKS